MPEIGISFILPTYNEVGNIKQLITELDHHVNGITKEFIVVDDNSTDGTWQLVEKMAAKDRRIRLILRTADHGLTASIRAGLDAARGDLFSWMDCDLSHQPEKVPEMINQIESGYDCVIGSRYTPGGGVIYIAGGPDSLTGIMLSMLLHQFVKLVLGENVLDCTSGFIVIRKQIISKYRLRGDYGEYFIDLMYRLKRDGHSIKEVPYVCQARKEGTSKTGSNLATYLKRGWHYLLTVIRLRLGY